jgi:hypothetical protein
VSVLSRKASMRSVCPATGNATNTAVNFRGAGRPASCSSSRRRAGDAERPNVAVGPEDECHVFRYKERILICSTLLIPALRMTIV